MEKKIYRSRDISAYINNSEIVLTKNQNEIKMSLPECIGLIVVLQELVRENKKVFINSDK